MKNITFTTILGLIIINALLIWYEKMDTLDMWKWYMGFCGLALISAIFVPLGLMLLIPITAYNLLLNTNRLRGLK